MPRHPWFGYRGEPPEALQQAFMTSTRWLLPAHVRFSEHLMAEVLPIWDHYSTSVMVITVDLLRAEMGLTGSGFHPMWGGYRWVHYGLTESEGIELRVIDVPGVLGWGFINESV